MLAEGNKLKNKFKSIKNILGKSNRFQYKRLKMTDQPKSKKREVFKTIVNIFHRFILLIARFIFRKIYGDKGEKVPPVKNLLLLDPASVLAFKIRTRRVTSVEVVEAFIERIKEVNPLINCVVDNRFDEALKEAKEADQLIRSGVMTEDELEAKKPFLGVPLSTKDCIAVKDLLYTGGLFYRKNVRATKDSNVITKMRAAGAIPFALTNVSELCMWYESNNTVHGRTNNPYDTFRIVGGSSGGEGAIQAAAASPFGIGSDIGGSIRMPAFFNGIFGHKPTCYVISNIGQFPDAATDEQRHMLSTGPMCRYAADLKPMMKILAEEKFLSKLKLDEPVDIKKLKVFYQENDGGGLGISPVDKDLQEALQKVVNHFKNNVKVEVNRVQIYRTRNTAAMWLANMQTQGASSFAIQAAKSQDEIPRPSIELFKWMFGKSNHTLIGILTMFTENLGVKPGTEHFEYLMSERDNTIDEFKDLLKDDHAVFLYPTHPCVAPYHNEPLLRAFNFTYTSLINLLGFPSCAIPLGLGSEGLPLGIQCAASYNNDRLCLAVAAELEKAFGGWVAFA